MERTQLRRSVITKDEALRLANARLTDVNARPLSETIEKVREALGPASPLMPDGGWEGNTFP